MSAPPEYSADSSPPSYDEVSQKLQRLIQDNTNPAKVLEIASSLSDAEINVLADGFEKHYPLQDEKQKADFTVGLGQTFSSKEGQARLKQAGNAASQAVKDIEGIFTNLQLKLAQIDQVYQSGFQATLIKIQDTFTDILRESRLLAVDIGQHGEQFDKIMVKFCANPNYTVDQRRARIGEFITEAKGFEDGAKGVQQRYTDLVTSFQSFVLSFSGWARDKEGELTSQIKGLEAELSDLGKQLNDIKTAQTAMTSLAGVVLPVTSLLLASKIFPGFDAVIIIGGLIAAGVTLSSVIGLMIAANRIQNEIDDKTKEKKKLEEQLEKIRSSRQSLESLGISSLPEFKSCISVLSDYWQSTDRDARLIQTWLEKGADAADQPEYMKLNLDRAVNTYASMSIYLYEYAAGVA